MLSEVDSEAQAPAQPIPKSPRTSSAASDRKSALRTATSPWHTARGMPAEVAGLSTGGAGQKTALESRSGGYPHPTPRQSRTRRFPQYGSSAGVARGYRPHIWTVIRGRGRGHQRSLSVHLSQWRRLRCVQAFRSQCPQKRVSYLTCPHLRFYVYAKRVRSGQRLEVRGQIQALIESKARALLPEFVP